MDLSDLTVSFSKFAISLLDDLSTCDPRFQPSTAMSTTTVKTEQINIPRIPVYTIDGTRYVTPKTELVTARKDSVVVTNTEVSENDTTSPETQDIKLPLHQNVLLLYGPRQPYTLTSEWPIPTPQSPDELVVKVQAIGLNPFDWKSAYAYL